MNRPPLRRPGTRGVASVLLALLLAALPALVASPAQAASTATWNRLAQCESSGNWSINTGNGYYGGLQFYHPTWVGFGGTQYAKRAHRATRSEQIRIAEKVLDAQGWTAWPACSLKLGLRKPTKAEKAAARKEHRAEKRKAGSSSNDKKHKKPKKHKQKDGKKSGKKSGKEKSGKDDKNEKKKKKHGKKKHGKKDKKSGKKSKKHQKKKSGKKDGKRDSKKDKKHGKKKRSGSRFYTVRAGDSLRSIAAAKRIRGGWPTLYRINRGRLRGPDDIHPGQRIRLRR